MKYTIRRWYWGFLMFLLITPADANTTAAIPIQYTLNNGLTLIVLPDHRAPVVVSKLWYRIGSADEYGGITGISHLLEHMMFRGTPRHPDGELTHRFRNVGAVHNAETTTDYTTYYQILPVQQLPTSFQMEADRMHTLSLTSETFKREIQIVMEERRLRVDDEPHAQAFERFNAAVFVNSPYHHLTIGWMTDLQHLTLEDLKQWYQTWYSPNNAILTVVGDVEPSAVHSLARRYFEDIPEKKLPIRKPQTEIPPLGEKTLNVTLPAELPWLVMGYAVPSLKTVERSQDAYALEVLSLILAGDDSSRLNKTLMRDHSIADEIQIEYDLLKIRSGLFVIVATPTKKYTTDALKMAIDHAIDAVRNKPVDPQELSRVKALLIAQHTFAQDNMLAKANWIGEMALLGENVQQLDPYIQHINAVTAADVQHVAQHYLVSTRLTTLYLRPDSKK